MGVAKWVLIITLIWNNTTGGISIEHIHGFEDRASCWNAGNAWANQIAGLGGYVKASALTSSKYLRYKYLCIPLDAMDDPRPTVLRGPKNPNVLDSEILTRINYGDR